MSFAAQTNSTPIVWIVRHAPTDWTGSRYCGRSDPELSAEGRAIAIQVAARLGSRLGTTTGILSSPARRAMATATRIAEATGASPPTPEPRLEEIDFGVADGLTWDQLRRLHPELAAAAATGRPIDWPGGETDRSVRDRAASVWADVADRDERVVLVTHAGLIHALLQRAAGADAAAPSWVDPGGIVGLSRRTQGWAVASVESPEPLDMP